MGEERIKAKGKNIYPQVCFLSFKQQLFQSVNLSCWLHLSHMDTIAQDNLRRWAILTVHIAIPDRIEILLRRNKGEWVLGKQLPCLLYDFSFYCVMTNPLIRWVPSLFFFFETLLDIFYPLFLLFSCSVVSDSLWPHGLQQACLSCPSPFPGASSNSCPLTWWMPSRLCWLLLLPSVFPNNRVFSFSFLK